jgi:hypothetical protein
MQRPGIRGRQKSRTLPEYDDVPEVGKTECLVVSYWTKGLGERTRSVSHGEYVMILRPARNLNPDHNPGSLLPP